jgi:hypothetical protein
VATATTVRIVKAGKVDRGVGVEGDVVGEGVRTVCVAVTYINGAI